MNHPADTYSAVRAVINGSIDDHTSLIIYSYSVSACPNRTINKKRNQIMRIHFTTAVTKKIPHITTASFGTVSLRKLADVQGAGKGRAPEG